MGYYINHIDGKHIGTSFEQKCSNLIDSGAKETNGMNFEDNLVCVVDNGMFAAAGYAFSEDEYEVFSEPDIRRKRWFIVPDADIWSGYKK